jgi:hypothetical protein
LIDPYVSRAWFGLEELAGVKRCRAALQPLVSALTDPAAQFSAIDARGKLQGRRQFLAPAP